MSVITMNSALTWAEVVKREGFDDEASVLGEIGQLHDFIDEVPWYPSSHGLYNKQLQAKYLGKGAFAKAYGATTAISSGTDEITEPVKMYEGDSNIDDRILKGVDAYKVRDSEDALNMEGLTQDWIYNLIYADEGDTPDAFKSLVKRCPGLSTAAPYTVWGAGGSGSDVSSLWLFEFSRRGFYLVYPENAGAPGIVEEDRGLNSLPVPSGSGNYWAWTRHFEIWAGLVLRDRRALQRLANIETAGSSNIFDPKIVIRMKNYLPSAGKNAVLFGNRTLKGQIDVDAYGRTNVLYSVKEIQNYGPITFVAGIPVRMMEPLLDTETAIT